MNLGFSETAFLVVLGLLLFGPKKLPEIGRQIGRIMAEFKRASAEFQNQLNDEVRQLEQHVEEQKQTILPPEGTAPRIGATDHSLAPNSGTHPGEAPAIEALPPAASERAEDGGDDLSHAVNQGSNV